ncbi:MAG: ECF transporter S component, partial [Clostridia bacterium]|nr:ECF transporter S component [Clostridia bacterium]
MNNKHLSARMLASIAVSAAISFVLMLLDFSLPIAPAFIKLDLSDLPALILSFSFGPLAGVLTELVKNMLHLFITSTAGVGEL